jgi:hypothetical protein
MDDYRGYVNLTEAARLVGVSVSTLSRHKGVGVPLGGRDIGIAPREVLQHASFFKRRPVTEVAGELVERAFAIGPEVADAVSAEVDAVLSAQSSRRAAAEPDFLAEARRVLPRRLFAQVARYYQPSGTRPAALGPAEDQKAQPVHFVMAGGVGRVNAPVTATPAIRAKRVAKPSVQALAEPKGLGQKA